MSYSVGIDPLDQEVDSMSSLEQNIPYFTLESEVGRNFDIRPLRRQVSPELLQEGPHRHSFQELLWVQTGHGRHKIDDDILEIESDTFYLIARGQVHLFIEGVDLKGYILRFSDDFLPDDMNTSGWDYRMTLFSHFTRHQMLSPDPTDIPIFQQLMDSMWEEVQQDEFGKMHILRHLLSVLLILLERNRRKLIEGVAQQDTHLEVFQAFIDLLENNHSYHHDVKFYANEGHLTPRQLSNITKICTGRTAKQIILERVILESKRLLTHSNASVKEISYALGFKDPSYFSKVFKNITGMSPNQFKED